MTREVLAFGAAWDSFASWLVAHCPIDHAALQPPATAEEITTLETQLGFPLHPHLRILLERHNGVLKHPEPDNRDAGAFLPLGYRLSGTGLIADVQEWLAADSDAFAMGREEDDLHGHAHRWVPVAHSIDAGMVFVDHHPGPGYGHVYEMGIGCGIIDATHWALSLAALFDGLATCLESGEPFQGDCPSPDELPSGHVRLSWGGSTTMASMRDWPTPRRVDSPLRPAAPTGRLLGRSLGALRPLPAPVVASLGSPSESETEEDGFIEGDR
ncbi:SMI1/KNR4 family protein [Streptomyces sp. NPDC052040]|uniref:SMI1/KNR4 family protein n=1 Tax=Streptomyces sp. NPDC052040 TaxID=3365682 RepID=UPI0037D35CBF